MEVRNAELSSEVLFEAAAFKLKGSVDNGGKTAVGLHLSRAWKKVYCVLWRHGPEASIYCHDKKPKSPEQKPKWVVKLQPSFHLEKSPSFHGKHNVCRIHTGSKKLALAFEDEKALHLFTFYTQCQMRLKEEYWGECITVRPDNSECMRRLGARGNMCILHIHPGGLTLALELSKCVLAHWPLSCIKSYESSGRNQFAFNTGQRAPMGEGLYMFNTRQNHDNFLYDCLDKFVMEAAALTKSTPNTNMGTQLAALQTLTVANSDPKFVNQLRRISRDMFDQLSYISSPSPSTRESPIEYPTSSRPTPPASIPVVVRSPSGRNAPQPPNAVHNQTPITPPYENSSMEDDTITLKKSLMGSVGSDYLQMQGSNNSLQMRELQSSNSIGGVQGAVPRPGMEIQQLPPRARVSGESSKVKLTPQNSQSSSMGHSVHNNHNQHNANLQPQQYLKAKAVAPAPAPTPAPSYDTPLKRLDSGPGVIPKSSPVKYSYAKSTAGAASKPVQTYDNAPVAKVVNLPPSKKEDDIVGSQQAIANMYTDMSTPCLSRLLSRSLDDVHSRDVYENDDGLEVSENEYSYAIANKPSNIYLQNRAAVSSSPPDVKDLYARPMSRAMRKSVSLSSLLDSAENDRLPPMMALRQDSKMSQGSQSSQDRAIMMSPTTMKGVQFTNNSKSFRKVQAPQVEIRRQVSTNPNTGRRLPSLPPYSAVVKEASVATTVC